MSKNKNIPLWPLYVADALMFAAVLLIAYPNIVQQQALSLPQTLMMVVLVIAAMFMLIVPYIIDSITEVKIAKMNSLRTDAENEEQFKTLFSDMRQLRSLLSEQREETIMNNEAVADIARKLSDKIAVMKQQSKDIFEQRVDIDKLLVEFPTSRKDVLAELSSIMKKVDFLTAEYDSIKKDMKGSALMNKAFFNAQADSTKSAVSKFIQNGKREEPQADEAVEDISTDISNEGVVDFSDDEDEDDASTESEQALDEAGDPSDDEIFSDDPAEGEESSDEPEFTEEESEESAESEESQTEAEDGKSEEEQIAEALAEDEIFERESLDENVVEKNDEENFENAGDLLEDIKGDEEEDEDESLVNELFPANEVESEEKQKPVKGNVTAIVLDAFVGIGNKPYVRGIGGGLSLEKGMPMTLVEIGRWQWLPSAPVDDAIKFTFWLNDETKCSDGDFTVNPNETIELQVKF